MKRIYPSLLQSANIINSNSWFDIKERRNDTSDKVKKKRTLQINYIDTIKIKLYPTEKQKQILLKWVDNCIDVYNDTNSHLKKIVNNNNYRKELNFINIRKQLNQSLLNTCKIDNLNKHTADYSVKHCVEMYKSAFSNHKDVTKFNITDMVKSRRRKNLTIEPSSVSSKKNSIFINQLGIIESSLPLKNITQNSILQYDSYKKTFIIISPKNISDINKVEQNRKCGIDIGVRSFLTTYSPEVSYEIGTNNNKVIDKLNKRIDTIISCKNKKYINETKYNKLNFKYRDKLKNLINDMHNKTAKFLLSQYRKIIIGKVSTKKMISNLTGNLHDIVKRRLMALSHYKFRMKLISMSKKFGCEIIETDEYLTSKNCSNCKTTNDKLGSSKIFNCNKCKLVIDRDINASINIYKNRILVRSSPLKLVNNSKKTSNLML